MTKNMILSGGLIAALLLGFSSEAMAQTFRNRLPTRPTNPAPSGSGLVTPSMSARALPNFATVTPQATQGITPQVNPGINATFVPGFNSFNYRYNNFGPFNPYFSPFANPYGGFGVNPYFSPYNTGFFPAATPFATPFNPYGTYNPLLGY
ncbi:MAG: hypothetical protein FJ271_17750 [Planctomycetes bacterium]|nr:hypothetical protein [Planctomycetota bacterium]